MMRCMSVKNKNSTAQCPHKRKSGSDYCGIHRRSKNIIKFDKENRKPKNVKIKKKRRLNSFKGCYENENQKKSIIKIQAFYRRWHIQKRSKCVNFTDFCTLQPLIEIPSNMFFSYFDNNNGFWYGFDIRSLSGLMEQAVPLNPYTRTIIPPKIVDRFNDYCDNLKDSGVELKFGKPKLSKTQKMLDRMLCVFQKIDMLGNYTDYNWFRMLKPSKLRSLYLQMQDIWVYRSNMTLTDRKRIVKSGVVFHLNKNALLKKSLEQLRYLILDDFDRMVTEGIDHSEKVLGAMQILTGLVQVSPHAAHALPQYVQIY